MSFIALALIGVNLLTLGFMWFDKASAKRGFRRVPEASLYMLSLAGGSIAMLIAMQLFRHKRRKFAFIWRIYAIIGVQLIALAWWLINQGA